MGCTAGARNLAVAAAILAVFWTEPARAAEFQQSPWPRQYYDIFAGFAPPPGIYVRNDLIHYEGRAEATPLFGAVDLQYTVDALRVTAFTPLKILGANYGFSYVGTVVGVDLDIDIGAGPFTLSDSSAGLGDSGLTPALLAWKAGKFNTSLVLTFLAPTGEYDVDDIANLGRNHWTFAPQLAFTWYDPVKGIDLSGAVIYTTSWENKATRYKTGDFIHLEASATKAFGSILRLGFAAFAQKQITDDSGAGAVLGGFRSDVYGIGPLVGVTLAGKTVIPLFMNAKWIHEFGAKNTFEGETVTVNALFKF